MSPTVRAIYLGIWFAVVLVSYALLGVLPTLANALWFAGFYLLLTGPVRTLRLLAFALFFFAGLLVVSHATLLSQLVIGVLLPPIYSNAGAFAHLVFLAPLTEETAKLVSVALVLLAWKLTGARIAFGATDLMLVGLAIGIGLNLFEDMFLPNAKIVSPGRFADILVPWTEMQVTRGRPDIVTINHAASTAFLGLALGWSRYLPKSVRYLPVFGVWAWMTWCHALYNGQDLVDRGHIVFVTAPLTWITPYVFFLAVIATVGLEFALLHHRVTDVEKQMGRRKATSWTRRLDQYGLERHLAYARVWLRSNPHDRAKTERYLSGVIARWQRTAV